MVIEALFAADPGAAAIPGLLALSASDAAAVTAAAAWGRFTLANNSPTPVVLTLAAAANPFVLGAHGQPGRRRHW